jgi:hypothetical protein
MARTPAKTKAPANKVRVKAEPAPAIRAPKKPYPAISLEKALTVAQAIKDYNGGNPWAPADLAVPLAVGPRSPGYFYLTAASRDFGLTVGTRDTEVVSLTDLGRAIVYAPDIQSEKAKKVEAFLNVEVFKKVLDHYRGSSLPEMKYLGNTLEREFGLPPEHHDEFSRLFRENCSSLGIITGTSQASYDAEVPGTGPATVLLGGPKVASGRVLKAFVIMPFVERNPERAPGFFGEVLRSLLTPAAIAAGFQVETANRQGSDVIQSTIINDLLEADLVIADLTDHNPNVLFELGMRMAEDKPVALVKASGTGRIFDVDNMLRVYEYSDNLWQSTIEKDLPTLTEHIKAAWEKRSSAQTYMKILRKAGEAAVQAA